MKQILIKVLSNNKSFEVDINKDTVEIEGANNFYRRYTMDKNKFYSMVRSAGYKVLTVYPWN